MPFKTVTHTHQQMKRLDLLKKHVELLKNI